MSRRARPDGRSAPDQLAREQLRRWYGTARWKRRRLDLLKAEPFCRMCLELGVYEPTVVADHIEPHRGDPTKFWTGELQGTCLTHHNSDKQRLERAAYSGTPDETGWPADPAHPCNQVRR